jgi:hypothetical protein
VGRTDRSVDHRVVYIVQCKLRAIEVRVVILVIRIQLFRREYFKIDQTNYKMSRGLRTFVQ